jgi:hypothetical protein
VLANAVSGANAATQIPGDARVCRIRCSPPSGRAILPLDRETPIFAGAHLPILGISREHTIIHNRPFTTAALGLTLALLACLAGPRVGQAVAGGSAATASAGAGAP